MKTLFQCRYKMRIHQMTEDISLTSLTKQKISEMMANIIPPFDSAPHSNYLLRTDKFNLNL